MDRRQASTLSGGEQRVKENEVAFQFGGQCVDKWRTNGLFGRGGHRGRCMAYINFDTISRLRVMYVDRRWHAGLPEERKQKKLSMKPAAPCEEPYVVDLLICLAQEQAALGGEENEDEGGWWAHVWGLEGARARRGFLYTAWIPKAFLDKLERPWEAVQCERVVIIYEAIKLDRRKPEETARQLWHSFKRNFTDFGFCKKNSIRGKGKRRKKDNKIGILLADNVLTLCAGVQPMRFEMRRKASP